MGVVTFSKEKIFLTGKLVNRRKILTNIFFGFYLIKQDCRFLSGIIPTGNAQKQICCQD